MKKHYFLTLMACALCSMSVEAQVQFSPQTMGSGNVLDPALVARQGKFLPQKTSGLLRSAENQLLPDSILYPNEVGGYNKDIYTYTDEGWVSLRRTIQWNYSLNDYTESQNEYEYDTHGNIIRQDLNYMDGTGSHTINKNTYDEQGRLLSVSGVTENLDGSFIRSYDKYEYDGNDYVCNGCDSTFSVDGAFLSVSYSKDEYHYDDAGNNTKIIWYSMADLDADGVQDTWYPWYVFENDYDALGLCFYSSTSCYDFDGKLTNEAKTETVYSDDSGLYYISTTSYRFLNTYVDEWSETYVDRYEKKAGNPAIEYVSSLQSDGTWSEPKVRQIIYYPQGSEVANETIGENSEPAFKAYAADGSLVVTTNEATHVQVFAVTGACVYNAPVNGMTAIRNLPAGIYIVKAGNEVLKISVR